MAGSDRIEHAIGNLFGNAVKYGDADAEILVVSSVNEGTAMLCVHNQGRATPDDIRSTLFEQMVRGSVANSRVRSVWLGLFIVRAAARAHGGSVEVVSDSGDGTTITIKFPA